MIPAKKTSLGTIAATPWQGKLQAEKSGGCEREANEPPKRQVLQIVCEDGAESNSKYQLAHDSRPLSTCSEICDAGFRVMFGSAGGIIYNVDSVGETYFKRVD